MTSRPRRSGGPSSKPAEDQAKEEQAKTSAKAKEDAAEQSPAADGDTGKAGDQPAPQPEKAKTDGGNAAGDGAGPVQRAADATGDTLQIAGDPVPDKVDQSMVNDETGLSPEVTDEALVLTAAGGDDVRNGRPLGIPTDTSGELRKIEGVPTAAFGDAPRNGQPLRMEPLSSREFGGNGDPEAKLVGSGVRGEQGVGTLDPDIGEDERPTYPSTTLTRATPNAAPMEPDDVKFATQPKLGDVQGSTDPTMAAAQMPSMPGDVTVGLVDQKGREVKPRDFFEVPDGLQARSFRRVKYRVSEVFTVRKTTTPGKRLLFTEGQMVPVDVAETLIRLHS